MYVDPAPDHRSDRGTAQARRPAGRVLRPRRETRGRSLPALGQAAAPRPAPPGLTTEQWWLKVKLARQEASRPTAADRRRRRTRSATPFPTTVLRHLHRIDQRTAGEVAMERGRDLRARGGPALPRQLADGGGDPLQPARGRYHLAGGGQGDASQRARATRPQRADDRQQLPGDLQFIKEIGNELTPAAVLELHRIVTAGTLDDPDAAGRLQRPGDDRVAVFYRDDDNGCRSTCHRRPSSLPERLAGPLRLRQRRRRRRVLRPSGDPGDPAPLLARLRPPVRGRQRPDRAHPLLLVDARRAAIGSPSTCRSHG